MKMSYEFTKFPLKGAIRASGIDGDISGPEAVSNIGFVQQYFSDALFVVEKSFQKVCW